MNEDIKKAMQQWDIPPLSQDDIVETIKVSKVLKGNKKRIEKYNYTVFSQARMVLKFHTPKVLAIQTILCILAFLFIFINSKEAAYQLPYIYFTIMFTSSVCMLATSTEMLRIKLFDMWEIEHSCFISTQRVLLLKLLLLGSISMLIIFIMSGFMSYRFSLYFPYLFLYGCIPFLFLTAFILQFSHYIESIEAVLAIYTCCIIAYFTLTIYCTTSVIILPDPLIYGVSLIVIAFFIYSIKKYCTSELRSERI